MFVFLLLAGSTVFGQYGWEYDGVFPDTTGLGKNGGIRRGPHGIQVDPDGKIWVVQYYPRTQSSADSIYLANDTVSANAVYVFNEDGTEADFSPIKFFQKGGTIIDTMGFDKGSYNSGRGIAKGADGNMVVCFYDFMYKLNYKTGEGMGDPVTLGFIDGTSTRGASCPAIGGGLIYVRSVFGDSPNLPLKIYDYSDMSFKGNAADQTIGFNRSIACNEDGTVLYVPNYSGKYIVKYEKPDLFSGFEPSVYLAGCATESINWDKHSGLLWVSGGSYNDMPTDTVVAFDSVQYAAPYGFQPNVWYGLNATTGEIIDSMAWQWDGGETQANYRPRAIAFSNDGEYAYVATFSSGIMKRYKNVEHRVIGTEDEPNIVATSYSLAQNYPNPFNPSTMIKFNVAKAGFVSLKVYNTLGQEVATLVNENLGAGEKTVRFNGANLASGTYIYRLNVNGVTLTNKMMLIK